MPTVNTVRTDDEDYFVNSRTQTFLRALHENIPRSARRSRVCRAMKFSSELNEAIIDRVTSDTGASSANYIGKKALDRFPDAEVFPCRHNVRLGDGATSVLINGFVVLEVSPIDDYGEELPPISTEFFIMEKLGDEAIIGLPDILGNFFDYFLSILGSGPSKKPIKVLGNIVSDIQDICDSFEDELYKRVPRIKILHRLAKTARNKLSRYTAVKGKVLSDPEAYSTFVNNSVNLSNDEYRVSKHGTVYADSRVEAMVAFISMPMENHLFINTGDIVKPWELEPEECPEELSTPDALSFSDDILHFMEMPVEDSQREYLESIDEHVSNLMMQQCPKVKDLLQRPTSIETFAPSQWNGLKKVEPVQLETFCELPKRISPKARPVREALYANAKKEFDRLYKYFYVESESPIASPLVIAPKATQPFIRFCGDYREINKYIKIPQQPIPIIHHELTKAAGFKIFVDLDMANSFHQIPLSKEFSEILSVKTPWGLFRPKFLPEGVGPASGLLQHIVRDAFSDFEAWTIVIFDNFLILADDYEDAYQKLEKVLNRCTEYGIVLKMKKSWIGVDTVTFFGYEVQHNQWKLSDTRKQAINELPFPTNKKQMQSFLGGALFFHHHIPDYSEWTSKLYEMTHEDFCWDPNKWTLDYHKYFQDFKVALLAASALYFPDYSLPWVIRCDASDDAVGSVLYQEFTDAAGELVHQPIAFASKRFSGPASNWDTFKREAYAIYHAVHSFSYYLRGKDFLVESDHQNLQWIESSQSPIVVRWRSLLQSFNFFVRHIPGRENKVADWMSRMYVPLVKLPTTLPVPTDISDTQPVAQLRLAQPLSFEQMMQSVHGGPRLHFGAYETWSRAKQLYPEAHISLRAVQDYVKICPMCQKMRDTGIKGLPSQTLSLKPPTYRRTIGMDHVSITPADKHGFKAALVLTEHFSHFVSVYPVRDMSSDCVLEVLIKHYSMFGLFDEIASDPGSALLDQSVSELNKIFGVNHKVSLVGRHQSNGVEGSIKQFIRHLRTYVSDSSLKDRWSEDTVLPLIVFALNSRSTPETGGYTPFQLKYGSQDATFFKLPLDILPGTRSKEIITRLDQDLQTIRRLSTDAQQLLVEQRQASDAPPAHYEVGDLILWNPREKPCDHLPSKLSPTWTGPFEVISQAKNDITCQHVNMKTISVLHSERVKPFFGSYEDALALAQLDYNQFHIVSINYFTGNPHLRTSMSFNVTFLDHNGQDTVDLPYNADLADSQQFHDYTQSKPILFPLTGTQVSTHKAIALKRKEPIAGYSLGQTVHLNVRIYDGVNSNWFAALDLPDKAKDYVTAVTLLNWQSPTHTKVLCSSPAFRSTIVLNSYDFFAYTTLVESFSADSMVLVTAETERIHPSLFQA